MGNWCKGAPARDMDIGASYGDNMNNYNYVPQKILTKVGQVR